LEFVYLPYLLHYTFISFPLNKCQSKYPSFALFILLFISSSHWVTVRSLIHMPYQSLVWILNLIKYVCFGSCEFWFQLKLVKHMETKNFCCYIDNYFCVYVCGWRFLNGQNSLNNFANRVKLSIDKHMAIQKPWLLYISGFRMCSIKIFTVNLMYSEPLNIRHTNTGVIWIWEKFVFQNLDSWTI
jgi:hypothetical protein